MLGPSSTGKSYPAVSKRRYGKSDEDRKEVAAVVGEALMRPHAVMVQVPISMPLAIVCAADGPCCQSRATSSTELPGRLNRTSK